MAETDRRAITEAMKGEPMPRRTSAIPSATTAAATMKALRSEATIAASASVFPGAGSTMSAPAPAAPTARRMPSRERIDRKLSPPRCPRQPGRVFSPRYSRSRRPTAL